MTKLLFDKDHTEKKDVGLGRFYKRDAQVWQPAGSVMWIWKLSHWKWETVSASHKNEISSLHIAGGEKTMYFLKQRLVTPCAPLGTLHHVVLPVRAPIARDQWLPWPPVTNGHQWSRCCFSAKKLPQAPLCLYIKWSTKHNSMGGKCP